MLLTLASNAKAVAMMQAQKAVMERLKAVLQLLKRKAALETKGVKALPSFQSKQSAATTVKTPLPVRVWGNITNKKQGKT